MLSVQLLGTATFRFNDGRGSGELGRSGRLLGSFLFAFADQSFRRDYLQDLFWSDLPFERARAALNTAVWRMRKVLSTDGLSAAPCLTLERSEVLLRTGDHLAVDSVVFAAQARDLMRSQSLGPEDIGRLQACADLYRGAFLDGEEADWALVERERLQALFIQVLSRLAQLLTALGRYDEAIAATRNILRIDPFREREQRDLLILLGLNGERATALRHYERWSVMLRQELGLQPPPETVDLIAALRRDDYLGHFERLQGERHR
ncbi:MAG TPA: BTAD domain-containing putative transcriptional regulator [Caulobacteraceae bacterium]|nr:BTAD domain-containing putative transcriptional regulator [Caulobacteraceae bacterium]